MAFKFLLFHLITAVVAVNLIFANEDSERFLPSFSSFFGGGDNSSSGLSNLPSLSDLPFFGSLGQGSSFFGSRQERSAEDESDDGEEEPQHRLFGIVSCNYTTQGGTRCASCRQSLACYPNNVGRMRTCRGLLRYCNNGHCSFVPGSECSSSGSTGSSGSSGSGSSNSSSSSGSSNSTG